MSKKASPISGEEVTLRTNVYLSNGIMLPFHIKAMEGEYGWPEETGEAFISLNDLEELSEIDHYDGYMNFDRRLGQALVDAGWAVETTGHSHAPSQWLRSNGEKLIRTLATRYESIWELQRNDKVKAIFEALSESDRERMAQLLAARSG